MARDLRLNIQGDSSSADKAFASATAALEKASKELRQAEARTDALAVKARKLAEAEERAADKTRDLAATTAALRKQIDETGDETGQLGRKLDRLARDTKFAALATDDYRRAADRAAADAREQARAYDRVADNARQAARAVAELGAASTLSPNGKGKGGKFFFGIGNGLADLGGGFAGLFGVSTDAGRGAAGVGTSAAQGGLSTPILGPALVGLGAAAAVPAGAFLGSAIGGGILAGGGIGVAAGGLAGAFAGDPGKYQAKWDLVTDHIKKRWLDSSKAFSDELDAGLKLADATLRNLPVEKLLAVSQSFVKPVTEGAAGGAAAAAQGLADALANAQPIVDKLGPAIGTLGHNIGDFFRATSMGSKGAADGLSDAVRVIGYMIKATGVLILGLENLYEGFRNAGKGVYEFVTKMPNTGPVIKRFLDDAFHINDSVQTFGHTLDSGTASSHKFGSALVDAARDAAAAELAALDLNDAVTKTRDAMMGSVDASIAWAQGWLDLKKELSEGTKTLDLNTQAGIDNTKAITSQIELAERSRDQTIANSDHTQAAIDAANKKYYEQVEAVRAAAYAAGFNKDKVDELIASLGAVPPTTKADVQVSGLEKSLGQGISLGNALNNIDGRTYHVKVSFSMIGGWVLDAARSVGAHARGGTFATSGPKKVGEHGQELIWGSRGEYVSTAEETRKLMSMAGGSSGGGSGSSSVALHVAGGADQGVGRLVQYLIDRGYIQAFAGGQLLTTRRS